MTSVRDILVISIILFVVGISILFAVKIGHDVNSNLLTITAINSTPEAVEVIDSADAAINMTDYIFLAGFIGFCLAIIIFGWLSSSHPILAPIYFIVLIIFVFIAIIFQLVWADLYTHSELLAASTNIPITVFILSHLGTLITAVGLIGILVMFGKPQNDATTF